MNWNTILISGCLAIGGGTLKEAMSMHDDLITIKMQIRGYDTTIADIRTRLAAVELDIQKMKISK